MARILVVLSALLLAIGLAPVQSQPLHGAGVRIALVIGNSEYRSIPALANPRNDARLIAERLKSLGFTLVGGGPQVDLDKEGFERAIEAFRAGMSRADIALFFYAGHGVQIRGVNWLVPISAAPRVESDVAEQMIEANSILAHMRAGGARLNVLVLDACRDNPFPAAAAASASGAGGLGRMDAPDNTLIAYATQPGNVALDGASGNSPYSKALAESIGLPGLEIRQVFNDVGVRVRRATQGAQQPWLSASPIEREYFLAGRPATGATQPLSPDVTWALGTWRGRLIDYPAALESERAYIVGLFDGRLRCYWQTRATAPLDVSCRITSTDATSPPNVQMLRTPRGTLSGTWRPLTGTDVYKIELSRVSEQVVLWPYLGMSSKASPATVWAVGLWAGQVQGLAKGSSAGREVRIEVVDDMLRCHYRGTAPEWAAAACTIADRKLELIGAGGAELQLTFNGRLLTGTIRSRNADRSYALSMQKVR